MTTTPTCKKRRPFVIVAVIIIAVLAIMVKQTMGGAPYDAFTAAMNQAVGPDNWSAQSNSTSFLSRTLTVNGLEFTTPNSSAVVKIASTEIGGLKPRAAEQAFLPLMSGDSWRGDKELKILKTLKLKGLKVEGETLGLNLEVDELALDSFSLSPLGDGAPEGYLSFLAATLVQNFSYKNLKITTIFPDDTGSLKTEIAFLQAKKLAFNGPAIDGLRVLDESGILDVLVRFSAQQLIINDRESWLNFVNQNGENTKIAVGAGTINVKNINSALAFNSASILNLRLDLEFSPGHKSITTVKEFEISSFEATDHVEKFVQILSEISNYELNSSVVTSLIANIQYISDLLVSPISFASSTVRGLEIEVPDIINIKMASNTNRGPFKAGQIPPKKTSELRGLEISVLPPSDNPEEDHRTLYDHSRDFGQTHFVIDAESQAVYDEKTGVLKSTLKSLQVKDLFEATGEITLGGLSPERLKVFSETSLANSWAIMLAPEAIFGDTSFNGLKIQLTDKGVLDRLYNMLSQEKGISAQDLREEASLFITNELAPIGLKNPEALSAPVGAFITDGGVLSLTLNPQP
ncbi:MAG: hypothetical protein ACRCTY_04025, partial [Candidatus Adiutrix sp.]